MLTHRHSKPRTLGRVVVMGAGGFVGGKIADTLEANGATVVRLTRKEVDLLGPDADRILAGYLEEDDDLVVTSALAPCKNVEMFEKNIVMMGAVCRAVSTKSPGYLLYVSSDAVFSDSDQPLTEQSHRDADNPHGAMHAAREVMLAHAVPIEALGIIRPTLIYGAGDPHNGYGPNRFRRLVRAGDPIVLFGEGEERRDHVHVDDVAALAMRMLSMRSAGSLNAVTGTVASFREIAEITVGLADKPVEISGSPRTGPMPHNGYRPFDNAATFSAFPDFAYTTLEDGLKRTWDAEGA